MTRFETAPKINGGEEKSRLERMKEETISKAALILAKDNIVGPVLNGEEQYVTAITQKQIRHKKLVEEKYREIEEAAQKMGEELEELYKHAGSNPSVEELVKYYNYVNRNKEKAG